KTAIAIKSCLKYADRRKTQQDTWLKNVDTDFFFVIGGDVEPKESDVLFVSGIPDSFESIAPKVMSACTYALENNVTNLLVCDDDTYVHWPRMSESDFASYDYLGFVRNHQDVPYMQGSCYWLSERSMQSVAKPEPPYWTAAQKVPDDFAVGRVLYGKVPYTHEHHYQVGSPYPEPTQWPRKDNNIIACHKMNFMQMHTCHNSLT
ncbi:MAG: hypothetical protein ACHQU0_03595, partial [Candidatus Paceibacteria bacterium]